MTQTKHHKTTEKDTPKDMKLSSENGKELPPEKTIGAFLRDEREKKGLSYEQVSEVTKLRRPILEALENESWDGLPSPVFAAGFVRSYGQALGVEEEKIMALFQNAGPTTEFTPKPLVAPARSKNAFIFILMFLLLALVAAYFFWKGYAGPNKVFVNRAVISPAETKPEKPLKTREDHQEIDSMTSMEQSQSDLVPKTDTEEEIDPMTLTEQPQPDLAFEADPKTEDKGRANDFSEEVKGPTDASSSVAISDAFTAPELTLKASVREMTWLRIFVDDQEPKEYTFKPEEHFQWKAKKGFELLIGNAGGIDFELNGKAVEYIGTPGKVVRLRLPKDYKRRRLQD